MDILDIDVIDMLDDIDEAEPDPVLTIGRRKEWKEYIYLAMKM
jgi:hypothetical protein